MGTKWTKEQLLAIEEKPNILVSAAAGSGKTAVLVERIIKKLLPDADGNFSNITNLLVVTFARDAAGEMQERIRTTLTSLLADTKDTDLRQHILRQLKLVSQSDITTIDAFCINVLRRNFHLLDIDPGFRIMDEAEADILKYDLCEEFLSSKLEEDNEHYLLLNKLYSSPNDDYRILKMLIDIYEFSMTQPNPTEWLRKCAEKYTVAFEKSEFYHYALEQRAAVLNNAYSELNKIYEEINVCLDGYGFSTKEDLPEEFTALYSFIKLFISFCKDTIDARYDTVYNNILNMPPLPDKTRKRNDIAKDSKYFYDKVYTVYSKILFIKKFFTADVEGQNIIRKKQFEVINSLVVLCEEFSREFYLKKKEKNMFQFSDIEHMTLRIFAENMEIREQYRDKYDEILMDEYQDTNGIQEAIFASIAKDSNRFMVGDMKQSIYRFRSSDPLIFKDKFERYSEGLNGRNIILNKNFRSRLDVLDGINDIFELIMHNFTAEIDYDNTQRLNCGNNEYEKYIVPDQSLKCEFHLVEKPEDDASKNSEIRYVCSLINEMIESKYQIFDKNEGLRPVRSSDFAILASSTQNIKAEYVSTLARYNIDATVTDDGFLDRSEICLMCSVMSVISNPLCDIALIAVMRSPLFSFTDNELAAIRVAKDGYFYDAVREYFNITGDTKTGGFIEKLSEWRESARYLNAGKMLWKIYTDTGIYDISNSLYDSDAASNLRYLADLAKTYEGTGYKGIYSFSSYINLLRQRNVNIEAKASSKSENAVNILTIHKSKGLEFPIVFIVKAASDFKSGSLSITAHKDFGIGIPYTEYDLRTVSDSIYNTVITTVKKNEETAEKIRVLYVAMTRAKEKLFIVASSDAEKESSARLKTTSALKTKWLNAKYSATEILSSTNFADWIAPYAMRDTKTWDFKTITSAEFEEKDEDILCKREYTDYISDEDIDRLLGRKYKNSDLADIPSRMYVTQFKNLEQDPVLNLKSVPSFMDDTVRDGATVGNAYHHALAEIDVLKTNTSAQITDELTRLLDFGFITENEYKIIDTNKIYSLFSSAVGQRLKHSSKIKRETAFEVLVPASMIFEGSKGEVLVQGICDCFFYDENGDIVLIDYKTDNVSDISELKSRYSKQLHWYKFALEKILKTNVSETYIYSISKNEWIKI